MNKFTSIILKNKLRASVFLFTTMFLVGLLMFLIFFNPVNLRVQNYYAYGDSITKGSHSKTNYMEWFRQLFNITGNISYNIDGSAKTTQWGLENFVANCNDKQDYIVFDAFGFCDEYFEIDPQITAQNKVEMYNLSKELNIKNYFVCIPVRTMYDWDVEYEYVEATEDLCNRFNIPFIRLYDAVDSIPYNEQFDEHNSSYFADDIHPNEHGHAVMSIYIWNYLNNYYNTGESRYVGEWSETS